MSRDKGKRGENEVVKLAIQAGLAAKRTAPIQAGMSAGDGARFPDVFIPDFPELWLEVKRVERLSVDAMLRQAEADAPEGHIPIVAWRRNNRPWSAVVPLPFLLDQLTRVAEGWT